MRMSEFYTRLPGSAITLPLYKKLYLGHEGIFGLPEFPMQAQLKTKSFLEYTSNILIIPLNIYIYITITLININTV